ncbi:MAG: endo-1,4-beta-xylanase, partial [Roseimicrobium sp.]
YVGSAWVRTSSASPVTVKMVVQQTDGWGTRFSTLLETQVADAWTRVTGAFSFDVNGTLSVLNFYFNGPPAGVDPFVDDATFTLVDTEAIENLLGNPGFETGTSGWNGHGAVTVAASASRHTGAGAAAVSGRTATWQGVEQSILGKTQDGRMYYGAGWVKTDSAGAETVRLTLEVIDGSGSRFFTIASGTATSAGWTWLSGTVTMPTTSGLTNVKFFVEGPAAGVGLLVDDCYLAPVTGLRRAAAAFPGLRLGAVGEVAHWYARPEFRAAVSAHFHLSSTENALKFSGTEPTDGIWTFANANTINELGIARGGSTRGHTLVWHGGLPAWLPGTFGTAQMQTILWDHMDTTMPVFRDRLLCWDVVNEAFSDTAGALRSTLWYDAPGIGLAAAGDQYIRESFLRARAADPTVPLFYNDYNIETDNTKSDALYTMLSGFLTAGVPVDGVGFQSHFSTTPNGASVRANLQRFQDLGLDLHITELDFRLPVDANGFATAANLTAQGDSYFDYASAVLGYSRLRVIQTWGLYDGKSWIPSFAPGFGQALLFDFDFNRKPAYWGLWNALAGQCEKMTVLARSSGDTDSIVASTLLSANAARQLNGNADADFITLRAHVPFSGSWNVKIGALRKTTGARLQLAIAPPGSTSFTNVGSVQDTYAAASSAAVFDLGTATFPSAGDWQFRFTVTGRNASATGYQLALDYLRLTPVACTPELTPVADQTIPLNSSLPPRLFLAEDETAQGTLQVTTSADNNTLLPPGSITVLGDSPYYTIAATPAAD